MALNIDMTPAILGETMIRKDQHINLTVNVMFDEMSQMHRVMLMDTISLNDASRSVTEGRDASGSIPILSVIAALPSMFEEVIILNKLMGSAVKS
jgi:hypothetical protein